jgi:hypothetical protein
MGAAGSSGFGARATARRDADPFWKFAIRPGTVCDRCASDALWDVQPHGLQRLQQARIPPPANLVRAQAFIAVHARLVSDLFVREERDAPYDRASADWTWHVGALPLGRDSSKR